MTQNTDICIIGAGLSGLALATALKALRRDVLVIEARDRVGGRILSHNGYDLGPLDLPHNARVLSLLNHMGLPTFFQQATGRLVFEDQNGQIRRDLDFSTMDGALRVEGGLARLPQTLARDLTENLRLDCAVHSVTETPDGVIIQTTQGQIQASHEVFALPPRLAIGLGAQLPDEPTWMEGHAKFLAVYPTPFWRADGLNGDAISHRGPLAEIHDASPANASAGALFGFTQIGAARLPDFQQAAITQLTRLFGPKAQSPLGSRPINFLAARATH